MYHVTTESRVYNVIDNYYQHIVLTCQHYVIIISASDEGSAIIAVRTP